MGNTPDRDPGPGGKYPGPDPGPGGKYPGPDPGPGGLSGLDPRRRIQRADVGRPISARIQGANRLRVSIYST